MILMRIIFVLHFLFCNNHITIFHPTYQSYFLQAVLTRCIELFFFIMSRYQINLLFHLIKKYTLSVPHCLVQEQSPVFPDAIAHIVIVNEDFANVLRSLLTNDLPPEPDVT